jgi:hypothetical protein
MSEDKVRDPFCPEHAGLCGQLTSVRESVEDIAENHLPHVEGKLDDLKVDVGMLRRDLWWVMLLGAALAGLVFRALGVLQ